MKWHKKNKPKNLYRQLAKMLVLQQVVTQAQCDVIARIGKRKEWVWKRHIIDLCEFVLEQKEVNEKTKGILEKSIVWCKTKGE